MATSLLDGLKGLMTPELLSTAARSLGESEGSVATGLGASSSTILAALAGKAGTAQAIRPFFDLINSPANDGSVLRDPRLAATATPESPVGALGTKLLSGLFGSQLSSITDLVTRSGGLRSGSGASLMSMAAPLVLGLIGHRVRSGGLNPAGLASMLLGEKDQIMRAAPAGLSSILGLGDVGRTAAADVGAAASRISTPALGPSRPKWLWPALAALALIAVLWGMTRNRHPAVDQTVGAVTTAATDIGDTVAAAVSDLGAFIKRKLPSGKELNIPERGVEGRLVSFLDDPSSKAGTGTWFDFDRLTFETGSASLKPESREQLQNVADILAAYPKVHLNVGGYTDNTGDPAANQKLSRDRADNVRKELIGMGVAADRLEAKGYGSDHPVADNSTEAGRAKNRRISLAVTAK